MYVYLNRKILGSLTLIKIWHSLQFLFHICNFNKSLLKHLKFHLIIRFTELKT
jgi:hypothetical protein